MASLDINAWPTEVLFAFFASLDPFELHNYAQVCKKWGQMSVDNELWRRFCSLRWDNLPKESDSVKNWLIPMREGGADKERRIDWRKVYLLRDLGEKAERAIESLTPEKKNKRVPNWMQELRKKKTKNAANINRSIFSEGFLTIKDLGLFNKKIEKFEENLDMITSFESSDATEKDLLMHITNFHLELELHILSQVNISRLKYLNFGSNFLRRFREVLAMYCLDHLPQRMAQVTQRYIELALKKDVPTDIAAQHFLSCTELYAEWNKTEDLGEDLIWYWLPMRSFIQTMTEYIHKVPLGEAWQQFLSEEFDSEINSPTHEIEESFNYLSMSLKPFAYRSWSLFQDALLALVPSPRKAITFMRVINAVAEGCRDIMVLNLPNFMDRYFFSFFQPSEDRELVISALYYYASLPSYLGDESDLKVAEDYAPKILPILLQFIDNPSRRIKYLVCSFIIRYCEQINDEKKLEPYLQTLLERLYVLSDDANLAMREEAILAICSLLMTSDNAFLKYKDPALKQFKKLLATSDKKTRDCVMEALGRIGSVLNETNKASIATDISELYAQAVEEFKSDRTSNEDLVVKLTEFAVSSLGNKFVPFVPIVLPVILEKAAANVMNFLQEDEDAMDVNSGDEDAVPKKDLELEYILGRGEHKGAVEAKGSALSAIWRLLMYLDTAALQPYLAQMRDIILDSFSLEHVTQDHIVICADAHSMLLVKHVFTTPELAKNCLEEISLMRTMFEPVIIDTVFTVSTKERIFSAFNKILKKVLKLAPEVLQDPEIGRQVISTITAGMAAFAGAECTFEEKKLLGSEIIDCFSKICSKITDKVKFYQQNAGLFKFLEMITEGDVEEDNDPNEQWVDLCVIGIACETFGEAAIAVHGLDGLKPLLDFLAKHFKNESPLIQQAVVNHYGAAMELCPKTLPTGDDFTQLVKWIEHLLAPEYHLTRPLVYDNALMAYMNVIYYCEALVPNVKENIAFLSRNCFPPAVNGDWEEVDKTLKRLDELLIRRPELFSQEIKENFKRGLEATAKYVENGDKEVVKSKPLITSLLAKLA